MSKKQVKKPTCLADLADKFYPNSPVQVTIEDGEFHIYIEGQWHSRVETFPEVLLDLKFIFKAYGDDWFYPSTRVNPTWEGWSQITEFSLAQWMLTSGPPSDTSAAAA